MTTPFGRRAGSAALDLVNTLDWRDHPARRRDLLATPAAVAAWARHAGFPGGVTAGIRLERQRARAIRLREALARLFRAVVEGRPPPPAALSALTRWTQAAWRHRGLEGTGGALAWQWDRGTDPADRVLYAVTLEAGDLLLSADRARVRMCAGAGCGWFFVDRSKAGRRRWCSMATCGNRDKVREFRARRTHG